MADAMGAAEARRLLLARMLGGGATPVAAPDPILPRDPARAVPLTAEQSQLWLHAQMAPDVPLYNESITIHRLGPYSHVALEWALSEIVRRHSIWRTAFVEEDGELIQKIAAPAPVALPLIDISHLPEGKRDAEAVRLATEDARAPIAFDRAPLFRARVLKLGEDEHRLYLTLHHIIFDGVSIYRTLVPELAALVAAHEAGESSPLAEPALAYADYAAWQQDRGDDATIEHQLDHWRSALVQPLPRLDVPGDRSRPVHPTHAGSMETFALCGPLVERLKDIARAEGATLYMVLLAAWKALLFRWTGDTDLIVGGVTDTRRRPELQPLMGYFLNTLALRSRPEGALPFRDYLAQVKGAVLGALGASDVPFDRIVQALGLRRGTDTHPVFSTLFSIEPPVDPFPAGWDLTQMDVVVGAAKYDLYCELDERPDGMVGRLLHSTELYDAATIRRMIGHWQTMLAGIAADPATPLARLPMLGVEERATLDRWNDTATPLAYDNVVAWFAKTAAAMHDAIAIEQGDVSWSFADLDARSNTIAARLVSEGVTPGALVGLSLERTPWMVAAMLGVAKAGAAYLPLDPAFPPARLAMIAEDARPALVLVEPGAAPSIETARLLPLDRDWPSAPFTLPAIDGEALAYVLYTSGSTGKPKGVEVPHAALANLLAAMREAPGFAGAETMLAVTTLSFDIAALELWLPLVAGGRILLAPRDVAVDMGALADLIGAQRPDVMQATPATWRGLIEAGWTGAPNMRMMCGGEALPRALADELLPRGKSLWNMYGPTETTIWSTVHQVEPGESAVPIGRPIANTFLRVLGLDGTLRPTGAVGELCIGGRGVAKGYRGRPNLTEQRFVTGEDGTRLYRTGDLVRWRADGVLLCLGRTDHEEKIRGFRVAIEEVEGALARLPGVAAAAVRAWPDASGERALAGYVVGTGDVAALRAGLAETLPDYMIPGRFVPMDALPLTPNSKVDRAALPEPGATIAPREKADPPTTPNEERLAEIWRAVLHVDEVSREDDFFDLGGHSLLVARLLRQVEAEYGTRVPMAALFRAPRLADMAALIASGHATDDAALIAVQPHGSKPPLLWLDGGTTFRPLAEALGMDQPFLGLSVDAVLEAAGGCPETFERAAALVTAAVRKAQPRGPYRLGGWCTSGILAYAVAVQMRAEGEDVALLAMIHAYHPPRFRNVPRWRLFVSKLRFHIAESMRQPKGARWRYFRDRLQGMSDAAALAGGGEAVLQPALRSALDRAGLAYDPPAYGGDMVLFQPAEHPDVLDFARDWGALVGGICRAETIPGGHRSMLEPPHVAVLAASLAQALATGEPRTVRIAAR